MPVLTNISYLATCKAEGEQGNIHPITDAAVAWDEGRIQWVGAEADLPEAYADPQTLYEKHYCARGDMENRIKEQQMCLFADRTSAAAATAGV